MEPFPQLGEEVGFGGVGEGVVEVGEGPVAGLAAGPVGLVEEGAPQVDAAVDGVVFHVEVDLDIGSGAGFPGLEG